MMDYSRLLADPKIKEEFLDRFPEIVAGAQERSGQERGFDGLEGGPGIDRASEAADRMNEGTWSAEMDPALEAIILRFTRPVYLVRDSTFTPPADGFPDSKEIAERITAAKDRIDGAIPSAGRIDLRNHRMSWVGTCWMVGERLAVTNRHVAEVFARARGDEFDFRINENQRTVRPTVDWRHEHEEPAESRFRVEKVLWIEPDGGPDVALLRLSATGEDEEAPPPPIPLMTEEELQNAAWMTVIGYPARDSRNSAEDQQRIFDGIFNVKRLAPGQITAVSPSAVLDHDATTLGGNSGSVVLDLDTGKAAALHFGGLEGVSNAAVKAPVVARIVRERA